MSTILIPEWEEQWKNLPNHPEMFLPEPNIFIAKDLSLKKPELTGLVPTKLVNSNHGELFHKYDTTFNQPRGIYLFGFTFYYPKEFNNFLF